MRRRSFIAGLLGTSALVALPAPLRAAPIIETTPLAPVGVLPPGEYRAVISGIVHDAACIHFEWVVTTPDEEYVPMETITIGPGETLHLDFEGVSLSEA